MNFSRAAPYDIDEASAMIVALLPAGVDKVTAATPRAGSSSAVQDVPAGRRAGLGRWEQ